MGCFLSPEMFPKLFFINMFLWILNFLFHWKLKEVTTEALNGAESTRTNLRRWEESSDLKVYVLQTGKVSFQSNLESCFYFSYCDSLKNCASQFSENCVQTVNDNNSEAQSKFQKVWNILISSFLEIDFAINISDKKSRRFDLSEVIFKCIKVL